MLLIFGTTVRMKVVGTLAFFCPMCGGDRTATERAARRWFTLFFIPIIPLKELGSFIQCETCHHTFDRGVLDRPTTATLGQILADAVRALTVMVVGAGDRHDVALRSKAVIAVAAVVPGYGDETLDGDLAAFDPSQAAAYVAPLADGLATEGAERFLGDLVTVALAAGALTDAQRHLVDVAGRTLGLTPAHVLGIIATAEQRAAGTAPS